MQTGQQWIRAQMRERREKMASTMQNREAWRTYLSSSSQENRDKSFLSPPSPPRITCSSSSRSTLMLYTANRALKLLP